jgi:hypothetical protein
MRRLGVTLLAALSALAGCSLFTSFRQFEDGDSADAGTADGTSTTDTATPTDASQEGGPPTRSDQYRAAVLADDPIVYLRLDEKSGVKAADQTGKHDAFFVRSPMLGRPGLFADDDAIELGVGSDAHVTISGTDTRFAGAVPFTFEAWVMPQTFANWQWIATTEQTSAPRAGWSVLVNANAVPAYEAWNGTGTIARAVYLGAKPLAMGAWQHVVFTYDLAVLTGYVDGSPIATSNTTAAGPNAGALMVGCRTIDGNLDSCLDGWRIDEIALYAKALSHARVAEHFTLGRPQ